jgi:hypothetical protein
MLKKLIAEKTVSDMLDFFDQNPDREFLLCQIPTSLLRQLMEAGWIAGATDVSPLNGPDCLLAGFTGDVATGIVRRPSLDGKRPVPNIILLGGDEERFGAMLWAMHEGAGDESMHDFLANHPHLPEYVGLEFFPKARKG